MWVDSFLLMKKMSGNRQLLKKNERVFTFLRTNVVHSEIIFVEKWSCFKLFFMIFWKKIGRKELFFQKNQGFWRKNRKLSRIFLAEKWRFCSLIDIPFPWILRHIEIFLIHFQDSMWSGQNNWEYFLQVRLNPLSLHSLHTTVVRGLWKTRKKNWNKNLQIKKSFLTLQSQIERGGSLTSV